MEKFVPYEKMSRKRRKEIDRKARGTWGKVKPATLCISSPGMYCRTKQKQDTRREKSYYGYI